MAPTPQDQLHANEDEKEIDGNSIVISGMSGIYPQSHHVKDLENILYNKINPVTSDNCRWDFKHPEVSNYIGKAPGLDLFDAQFFKVHYRLAQCFDVLGRKSLEQAFQAIYDAGLSPEYLNGKRIGVYIGCCFSETEKAVIYSATFLGGFGVAGCNRSMFANRISYWLNAKGPSMTLDASDCSGLSVIEQAYIAIKRGDCDAALVGSSNVCLHPQPSVHYARIVQVAKDGKTKSFDGNADGCARSDSINMLLLQKAKDAKRIYAEVVHVKCKFTKLLETESGPKLGFYRDPRVVADFLKEFYTEAGVPPHIVQYVEGFGSGVSEADKEELEAIESVFCHQRRDPLLVGSVMSNIGYTEAASGISAVTKVLLGYQKGLLASNLHCTTPRQDIGAIRDGRMKILTEHTPIEQSGYMAVNSNAVTGVNGHILLKGYNKKKDIKRYKSSFPRLVNISCRQEENIQKIFDELKSRPIDPEEIALLHNIHQYKIPGHMGRGYIILDTNEEQTTVSLGETAAYYDDTTRPLWFVYSGMGSQWAGMGAQLMRIPIFAAAIERCRVALEPKGIDIVHIITSPDKTIFDNILNSFVGIAAIQIGLTDILNAIGLKPDKVIGHSVGELGCAYADGCFTAEEMILAAYSRGLVSVQTPFIHGSMAAVGLGYEKIIEMVPPEIVVACHNSSESSTISGPSDKMKEFVAKLTAQGIFAKEVPCSNIAYHSRYIAEAGPGLLKYLKEVIKNPKERSERWVSTSVPQNRWDEPLAKYSSAEYHTNNLLNPVLFEETSRLIPSNAILVEIAPHGLLQAILKRSLPSCQNIPLTRRGHHDNTLLVLDALGKLYVSGYNLNIAALYPQVQFPVSTNTPMLSHLIEWAHAEKWTLTLFDKGKLKKTASCHFVLSTFDTEHSYLKGYVFRGQNLFPYAAMIAAVWDTFCMMNGFQRRKMPIDLRDVHLYAQPPLHTNRPSHFNVSINRGNGRFEVTNDISILASGVITALHSKNVNKLRYKMDFESKEVMDLEADDVYQLLYEKNLQYDGDCRSIYKANSSLNEAHLIWNNNWVTLLDGLFQLENLRRASKSFSVPTLIRRLLIDNTRIFEDIIDKKFVEAHIFENHDFSRCGGILLEGIRFKDVPELKRKQFNLKTKTFIPNFCANVALEDSWKVYLQIVSENINKDIINVVGIVNQAKATFADVKSYLNNVPGVKVNYNEISADKILTSKESFLSEIDLALVQNLSLDEFVCQMLFRVLKRDSFIVNLEETINGRIRPSTLYSIVSSHSEKKAKLELLKWRPTQITSASSVVTVRTASDLDLLMKTRSSLPARNKLVIVSPDPPLPGLKDLVKTWRKETEQQINLVSVSDRDALEQLPEINLAFKTLREGMWGGEYYLPCLELKPVHNRMVLQCDHIGKIDSMSWIEAPELSPKLKITVHYAALNYLDAQKVAGVIPVSNVDTYNNSFGMDYSGLTESGERVMGLVPGGATSTTISAISELMWPVPKHWTLEDAVTVPSAYAHAFYILGLKLNPVKSTKSIIIHGGAGALGQALIQIALNMNIEVFTTVSDVSKKRFLMRLFPQLKEDHIGNSRDRSFADMISLKTKGIGCSVIVTAAKGELKEAYLSVCENMGTVFDINQINSGEPFELKMFYLTRERNYHRINFNDIFNDPKAKKSIQTMISEGIARGYVRPLSRIVYDAVDASRGFRLLASAAHRGRVVLRINQKVPVAVPSIVCSSKMTQLVICLDGVVGIQLADRLVRRGARNLRLNVSKFTGYLRYKIRTWEKNGVNVDVISEELNVDGIKKLLVRCNSTGPVEGIYVVFDKSLSLDAKDKDKLSSMIVNLDAESRKLCPSLRYFAVANFGDNIGRQTCIARTRLGLPATAIDLSAVSLGDVVDATEVAVRTAQPDVAAFSHGQTSKSVTEQIADITGIKFHDPETTYLVNPIKVPIIHAFLRDMYNVHMNIEELTTLTVAKLRNIEDHVSETVRKEIHGLGTFYSGACYDELKDTTPVVRLPTLVQSEPEGYDEFDVSKPYIYIIPGLEGHHNRFRVMCERLKSGALVIQPGFDSPYDTVQQTADKYAKILRERVNIKDNFYLVGYESGVFVALEVASILEECGLKGTVFCIGGTPEELQSTLKQILSKYQIDEDLQNDIIKHMVVSMSGSDEGIDEALEEASTWEEKINISAKLLLGRLPLSAQCTKSMILSAYTRIKLALQYEPQPRQLNSRVILLRSPSMVNVDTNETPASLLQQYSKQPVVVHDLEEPLAHTALDPRIPAIINSYLDKTILEAYETANLCDDYRLVKDLFRVTAVNETS